VGGGGGTHLVVGGLDDLLDRVEPVVEIVGRLGGDQRLAGLAGLAVHDPEGVVAFGQLAGL